MITIVRIGELEFVLVLQHDLEIEHILVLQRDVQQNAGLCLQRSKVERDRLNRVERFALAGWFGFLEQIFVADLNVGRFR